MKFLNNVDGANKITVTDSGGYFTGSNVEAVTQEIGSSLSGKQATLVSGTTIKTINGASVLGSGNLTVVGEAEVYVGTSQPTGTEVLWYDTDEAASGAVEVPISDVGSYYTGTDVETALQEVGSSLQSKASSSHTHGNITNDGKIGTTTGLMVKTTTAGALTTLAAGTTAQFLRGDGTWQSPPAGTVTSIASGNGTNFTTITSTGTITLGTPSTLTTSTTNGVTSTSHTHAVTGLSPTGAIMMWSIATAPTDWLLCDGTAVSRTTYSALYAVIGTAYGTGDGSTTFNLPNLKGRVPVGRDSADTSFDVLGETGGAKTHQLSVGELPTTNYASGDHAVQGAEGASGHWMFDGAYTIAGTGTAHNNLQPYIVLNYIIKT